jgi:hypothetical protein
VREPWQRINAVMRDALASISLADLACPVGSVLGPIKENLAHTSLLEV